MTRLHHSASIASACAAIALAGLVACSPPASDHSDSDHSGPGGDKKLRVAVSIAPQADFIRRIGGDDIEVDVFVAAGQDPHHFSATPKQVMSLAGCSAFFTIGMPFEEALAGKIAGAVPDLRIVDMAEGIELVHDESEHDHDHGDHEEGHGAHKDDHDHDHGDEGHGKHEDDHDHDHDDEGHGEHKDAHDHDHGDEGHADHEDAHGHHDDHHGHDHSYDPHIWLAPPLIDIVALNIYETLVEIDPGNESKYTANLAAFRDELDMLHADLTLLLDPFQGSTFYVYHPAFTHFAETYGLHQKSIEAEGKSPTPKQLMNLIEEAKKDEVKIIFVQPQYDSSSARTVAEAIGGQVASIDPLADDVLVNIRHIADTISETLTAP